MYYEGWDPARASTKGRTGADFLGEIASALQDGPEAFAEGIALSAYTVLERHISPGELGELKHVLPAGIRALMP